MMKLHYAPNTISVAVAICLHEAGLDYTPVKLDFAAAEQAKPAYHRINPKGRVPALETDHGVLTETGAILDYIATQAPDASLIPADPFEAARMRSVMYYLASTMHVNHAHMRRGHRWADQQSSWDDMAAKTPQTMADSAQFIETQALQGPFTMGDRITLADPYLFILCSWLERDNVDASQFVKISSFLNAMRMRPSVQRAVEMGML